MPPSVNVQALAEAEAAETKAVLGRIDERRRHKEIERSKASSMLLPLSLRDRNDRNSLGHHQSYHKAHHHRYRRRESSSSSSSYASLQTGSLKGFERSLRGSESNAPSGQLPLSSNIVEGRQKIYHEIRGGVETSTLGTPGAFCGEKQANSVGKIRCAEAHERFSDPPSSSASPLCAGGDRTCGFGVRSDAPSDRTR